MRDGISVTDADGNVVGKSALAGSKAITQVAISRVATAFPAVFLPGIIMTQLERTVFMKNNPRMAIPINLMTISFSLLGALPCAIALYPQVAEVPVAELEAKFHGLRDKNGVLISTLYFNRGL